MSNLMLHAERALLPNGWAENVRVVISDGVIEQVQADTQALPADQCLQNKALLAAPSNLHSHAFQRVVAGRNQRRGASQDSFWSWRRLMYRFLEQLTPEMIEAITAMAQIEMAEAGYAAVAEFHYLHHQPGGAAYANPAEMSERVLAASADTGLGITLLPVIYAAAGADSAPPSGGQLRFACDHERYERLWEGAANGVRDGPNDWHIGIAPHSLRAVPQAQLSAVLKSHPEGPVHIHVAEQSAEVNEIQLHYGARPVEWLLDQHALDKRWCLIHATHINAQECAGFAASGAVAGLCPITEADLGDGIFPAQEFHAAGGLFGVGTDSNVRISLTEELRLLEYGQRLLSHQRNVLATAGTSTGRTLFEAALAGGAQALGRPCGAIAAGQLADLLTIDVTTAALHGLNNDELLDGWIFSSADTVSDLYSAGRHIVEDGRHVARAVVEARFRQAIDALAANA